MIKCLQALAIDCYSLLSCTVQYSHADTKFNIYVNWTPIVAECSGGVAMDNAWTSLVILLLADPHLPEWGQRGQDGTTNPHRVLPLWWSNNLDLHTGGSKGSDLLLHSFSDAWKHCAATRQHNVGIHLPPEVNVTFHDGVIAGNTNTSRIHAQEGWLKQGLRAAESLVADGDHLPVGEFVTLLQSGAGGGRLHFLFKVQGHVAKLLLDVTHDLMMYSRGCEGVVTFFQDLRQVVSQLKARVVHANDSAGESRSVEERNGDRHAFTGVVT